MIPRELKSDIIQYCHRMDSKGWVANHDGNISVRIGEKRFAATPSGLAKINISEDDLIEVNEKAERIVGKGKPFSEIAVHLRILNARPEVQAVIHAHPPSATAVGCANQEMLTSAIPEAVVSLGPGVPLVGLELPNSEALWSELDLLLPHYDAVMIGGNGVFAWGKTLDVAYLRLELVEHLAKIFLGSLSLGGPHLLQPSQVAMLLKKRTEAGLGLPADPNRPKWFPTQ